MARLTDIQLARRGRGMYELGRARWASHVLLFILPLVLVARAIGRPTMLVLAIGAALVVLAFALALAHDRYARAVLAGVLSGLPALAVPLLLRGTGAGWLGGATVDPCLPASFLSGILAGVFVSLRAVDERHHVAFWVAAVCVAALTGTLGCSVAGGAGVLGLLAGVVAGTAPVVLRAEMRRS
jgi:hypothetical protein